MHLVLIETSGNQRYIFATNKLRENVGASELTYRVTTQWTLEADENMSELWPADGDAAQLRKNLLNQRPILMDGKRVEVIVATSSKVMLLVEDCEIGKEIISNVTTSALKKAPGIDVCGVISPPFDPTKDELGPVVESVHRKLNEQIRDHRPGPALRFLRLPVVRDCATSGLPAAEWEDEKPNGEPAEARSRLSLTKRSHVTSYDNRMRTLLKRYGIKGNFEKSIDKLDKYCDWLAVVHVDGNGIGQVFKDFWIISGCAERREKGEAANVVNQDFITQYRKFSIALDLCTEEAFATALKKLQSRKDGLRSLRRIKEDRAGVLPVLPIVLGGDDLTVVCDGQAALHFTHDFLAEFERLTSLPDLPMGLNDVVPQIATAARHIANPWLTASAGVAIVKPHFPFSAANKLSERLRSSAKTTQRSALDYHVLYDASGSDLDLIRKKLQVEAKTTWLYTRPYVLGSIEAPELRPHAWQRLAARVNAILRKDEDGRRLLPNSQLHDLRGGLFLGKQGADARYQLIRQRYFKQGIAEFDEPNGETGPSLFFSETVRDMDGTKKDVYRTGLLDALDAANFWPDDVEEI